MMRTIRGAASGRTPTRGQRLRTGTAGSGALAGLGPLGRAQPEA